VNSIGASPLFSHCVRVGEWGVDEGGKTAFSSRTEK
jgi:hypothetical protein